jgi:nucleotide-binding universal stress UspA family protein
MHDRILVPVDGSPYSEEVIPYVLGIQAATGARLTLLRVIEKESERQEAAQHVKTLADALKAEARTVLGRDSVAEAILEEAARVPATLVAITSRGRSGLLTAMLGSVALDIVRAGRGQVLVYRPAGKVAATSEAIQIKTVVLPLDGGERSESMQAPAAEWARVLKAPLLVVQAISPDDAKSSSQSSPGDVREHSYVRSRAVDLAAKYGVEATWEVLHGEPVEAISSHLNGRRDVLIVMATRGQTAMKAAVLGSVTSGLLHEGGAPIVVQVLGVTADKSGN